MTINIAFFGTPEFAVFALRELLSSTDFSVRVVVTQPDSPAGRGQSLRPSPVKELALRHQLPILQPLKIKKQSKEFIAELNSFGPLDLNVVVAFGQILPESLLKNPRAGSVNVHASLLPRWRGAAPIQRALLSGDKETGVCLMAMDAGLDTGPVYISKAVEISPDDNFESMHNKLGELGGKMLIDNLQKICSGELRAHAQPEAGVTYASKISNDECLINWHRTALELSNQIRALSPIPGAFSYLDGKRLKIFKARPKKEMHGLPPAAPGQVVLVETAKLEIQCAQGVLSLEEVQLEGKRRMPLVDFLKGANISTKSLLHAK